jgi:hypothetical protein
MLQSYGDNNNANKIQFQNYGLLVRDLYRLIATKFLQAPRGVSNTPHDITPQNKTLVLGNTQIP